MVSKSKVKNLSVRSKLIFLAGVFEGEGNFGLHKSGSKKGKEFVVARTNEEINDDLAVEEEKIQVNFNHTGERIIFIKSLSSDEKKLEINCIIASLNKLREKMIARKNI